MTYQELAAYLRSEYSPTYGGEEWRDDILLVEDYMTVRPDAMDWDVDISNFNELQGLTEEGAPLPVAGYGKQLKFGFTNIGLLLPQMVQAEQAEELMKGVEGETTTAEDIGVLPGVLSPWEAAPEDREESWGEWYMRSMANLAGAARGALGAPIDKVMAMRRLMLQQTGRISPEIAEGALRGAEDYRRWKNEWTNEWIDSDPELQGLLLWNKEHPVGFKELIEGNAGDVVMRGLIQAAPSLGAFMAANYIAGPQAAMGVAFALGKAASYDETMSALVDEMGIPPEEAIGYANDMSTIVGAGEMILESIGGFGISKALGRDKVAKKLYDTAGRRWLINKIANPAIRKKLQSETAYTLVDVMKSGGKEYLTEAFQEMNSFLGVEAAKQGYGDGAPENALADITKQYGDFLSSRARQKEVWKEAEAGTAGFVGFIAGVSVSATGLGPSAWDDYQYWKQQKAKRAREDFFKPVREAEEKRRFDEEVEEAEFEDAGVPIPIEKQLGPGRRHIDFIEDDALMLNLITGGLESIPEDQKERAIYLRKVYGLSNNRKALEKINDILNRRADVVEKAGLTPAGIKEGIIAQFPSDNKDLNKIISSVNERVDKYEAGEITPTGEEVSKPKEGLPLDVLDRLEGVDVPEGPPDVTDVVSDLFEQRDIEPYVEEEVTDPDQIISPEEDVVIDVAEPTGFEEPSEEVLKFAAEGEEYRGDNIVQTPTIPADEQLTPAKPIVEVPETGEITVYRDEKKSTIKIEKVTNDVAAAIQKDESVKEVDALIVEGDQAGLIRQMQQMNVPGADKIPLTKDGKVDYTEADPFIQEFFKDDFKYIRYNNKQLEQKGVEFHDLETGEHVTTSPILAKIYAGQRKARDLKKKVPVEEKPADIAPFIFKDNIIKGDEILGYDPEVGRFIKGDEVRSKEDYLAEQEPAEAASYDKEGEEAIVGHTVFADNAIKYDNLVKVRYEPKNDRLWIRTLDGAGRNIAGYTEIQRLADPMRRFESKDDLKAEIFNRYYEVVEKLLNSGYITTETKLNLSGLKLKKDINKVSDLIPEKAPAVRPVDPSDIDEGIEVTGIDLSKFQKKDKKKEEAFLEETSAPEESQIVNVPRPNLTILSARTEQLQYTGDQTKSLTYVSSITTQAIEVGRERGRLGIISGYAGTGKTTIIENIAKDIKKTSGKNVFITAPTNKAVLRLREVVDPNDEGFATFATVHSAIYGEPDEITGKFTPKTTITGNDVVIIDEASMIPSGMWEDLEQYVVNRGADLILLGDGFQLPPVLSKGENDPQLLTRAGVEMKEVRRQELESNILSYATFLRKVGLGEVPALDPTTIVIPDGSEGDVRVSHDSINMFLSSLRENPNQDIIYITATNKWRERVNDKARVAIYGGKAGKEPLLPNEKVIFIANGRHSKNGEVAIIATNEGLRKIDFIAFNPKTREDEEIRGYVFESKDVGGRTLLVPKWENPNLYHQQVKKAPSDLMETTKKGKRILARDVNVATYGYAITAHKSQGSQWDTVYVDQNFVFGDNPNRWLYTAATRAQKNLVIQQDGDKQNLSWNGIHSISKGPQPKRPPGFPQDGEIDERLQTIALGDKIEDNYEAFLAIESRLRRHHPYVNVQKLNQVFTQHGEEVAGKAIGTGIQISMTQGNIGIMAHEYAEVYVDLLEGDKFVNDALNRLKQKDRKQAKHLLASHIDQYYTGKMKDKGLLSRMKLFLKRFLTTLKSLFRTLEDQELYDLIANKFFAGVGARRAQKRATAEEAGPKEEALQPLNTKLGESRLAMFFDEMWFRVKAAGKMEARTVEFKSVLPDIREFIQTVQGSIPQVYQNALKLWAQDRFPREGKAYYEHTRRSNYHYTPGVDEIAFLDYGYIQRMIEDDQFADINEGMGKVNMGELDIDLSGADVKLESVVLRDLGVTLTTKENNALFHKTRDAESFTEFLGYFKNNIKPILRGGDHTQLLRYYLARRSTVAVNREDRAGNERDNLVIDLNKKNPSVQYAGPLDIARRDKKNKKWDKINLLEHITGQRLIWATGNNTFKQSNGVWDETYGFLTAEDLVMLEPSFNKLKIVPVFTRGEKANLGFVEWNKDHEVKAANARKYWQKQFGEGKITEKQMLNFLGANRDPADITYEFLAGEIARFEAYENMFPGLLKTGDGAKMLKRAKIPTVGVSISDEIPDQSLEIFDPTNVSFVSSNGHVQPAMVQIPGHEGLRYIFDGGTPTSHDAFNDFRVFMGLQQGAKHFKTVVYNNDATDLIAMKHQHFEMESGLEAWENHGKPNAKLLWKVDENRNIINAEGEQISFMNTGDESKIASSNKMTIPGNAIGSVKYGNTHTTGKHPLQVYNYRREDAVKEAFKKHYLPQIDSRIKNEISGILFGSKDKTNWEHVLELVEKLDGSYPDFATHSLTEKASLEADTHADMTTILKILVQSKIIGPAVQLDKVKGSILEFRPSLDGTVQEGQMSVPYKNVKNTIIKDYTTATGDKKAEIADVNEWLSNNENHMYSYRSPIPYGGGAHMMRVISVHNDNDIVQLHPNDLFGRYEGDNDGDTLHIEQVPKDIVGTYLNVQEDLTTIDMNKYAKKELVDISDRGALYDLIGEMTFGGRATGEIANIQNVYGQLQDTFYKALLDGETIVLRGPKESSSFEGFEKENMETALRYYLQAALDNAEFLILKKMDYNRPKLMKGLFKKSTGEEITDEQYEALKPLLNEMLEAPRLRNGRDKEGPYTMEKTMRKSAFIHAFSHARTEYFMQLYEEAVEDSRNRGTGEIEGIAKFEGIYFFEGQTVVEEIASRPFVVYNQMKKENPEYFQHIKENTFIEKTYNRHSALHQATMNVLIKAKPLQDVFFKEAEEAGLNIKEELRKGKEYEEAMGNAYFGTETTQGLIGKLKTLGPQVWDKSEEGIRFTEDWVDQFNALSNIAKIEATFRFLERHAVASKLPPYGDKSKVMGLLHAGIMKNYNKIYNKYELIPQLDVTYGKEGKVKIQKYPGELAKAYDERASAKHRSKFKGIFNFRKKNCP